MDNAVLELTQALIKRQSVTPEDDGCQALLTRRLRDIGFSCEQIDSGAVKNLWATRTLGAGNGPHLVFAGHTDVVPTGPLDQWTSPPFEPTLNNGHLYGRGAADMKASLAAMVVACERLMDKPEPLAGTLSFLITSDEEGPAVEGTRHVVDILAGRGIQPHYCIVGEPSSSLRLGDVVRCGRRGSINAVLTVRGVQGHVAYPDDALNPIHQSLAALDALAQFEWDQGNDYYPPTSLQISNIHGGTGATNVIPGDLRVDFNLRFSTEQTPAGIQTTVDKLLTPFELDYNIEWTLSGLPFLTEAGALTNAVSASILDETGITCELSTSGGTSDGRFIAPWNNAAEAVQVVELGPINKTIHKIDECVRVADLVPLARIYQGIGQRLLSAPSP